MRIAHIFHSYYPALGGLERAAQCLAEEQVKLGHEVSVITSDSSVNNRPKEEVINGVKVIRAKSMKMLYNDLTIPLEETQVVDVDIVHAHSQNSLFSVMTAERLKKKLHAKVAFYIMAVDALSDHPNLFVRLFGPHYGKRQTKKALKLSDLILVKSMRDKEILGKRYSVKAVYLPDAVPNYYPTLRKGDVEKFKGKFNIKQNNLFLFIGRLHRLKGPSILVEALRYINDEDTAAVFVGPDCGYKRYIIKVAETLRVKDRVHVLGYLDEETKIHAIDSSIALILPSISDYVEVYPIVISEAWARGKPVIASSIGGIPYRVKNYENGILVRPSDAISLANAMKTLLSNHALTKKLGENGEKKVKTWEEIGALSISLYERAV